MDVLLEMPERFYWSAAVRTDLFGNPRIPHAKRLEVARKFADSGCLALGYSLESGSQEILDMMEKRIKLECFEEQIGILREVGITSNTSVVFGYPIETPETMRQTFEMCERNLIYPSVGFLLPLPDTGMYSYALEHGHITDENAFLDSITERQDICLNMTRMSDAEILDEIVAGCSRLNEKLELGLSEDSFVRTGGYRRHTRARKGDDGAAPRRNPNDVSFNYRPAVRPEPRRRLGRPVTPGRRCSSAPSATSWPNALPVAGALARRGVATHLLSMDPLYGQGSRRSSRAPPSPTV